MHEDRGRWIPLLFIAGLALLVVVQAGFAWLAIRSDPGVATPNAYERGLAHNAVLRQAAGEAALGWRIAVEPRAGVARRGTLVVTASDAQARPLDGLTVTGLVQRPTRAGLDLRLAFHFIGAGRYQADYELPLAGLWALDLLLERDGVQVQHAVRFSVP
ncbi:MAG: FixH family protein [Proteobacteria bacterium]|nr:FixH family protein [Pseudomonadota bacterium]